MWFFKFFWNGSETHRQNCILLSKISSWRCQDCWPKLVSWRYYNVCRPIKLHIICISNKYTWLFPKKKIECKLPILCNTIAQNSFAKFILPAWKWPNYFDIHFRYNKIHNTHQLYLTVCNCIINLHVVWW